MNGAKLNAMALVVPRARGISARTETGELHINSSKLREEHIGIGKTVAFSFKYYVHLFEHEQFWFIFLRTSFFFLRTRHVFTILNSYDHT